MHSPQPGSFCSRLSQHYGIWLEINNNVRNYGERSEETFESAHPLSSLPPFLDMYLYSWYG